MIRPTRPQWRPLVEAGIALVVGTVAAALSYLWLVRFHLSDAVTAEDFLDYCSAVVSILDQDPLIWPLKRARLPAYVPAFFAREHGVFDGLLLGSVTGLGLCGAGWYLWGSALLGRVAGLATVGFALTMSPLVVQARMVSTYPLINATLALMVAGTAIAARTRSRASLLLSGAFIGLSLLADVRTLIWALPCFGISLLVAVLARGRIRLRLMRVLALCLPIFVSYQLGPDVYPRAAHSLEEQADVRPLYHLHGSRAEGYRPPFHYSSGYVWGRSPITEIPQTLLFMAGQARTPPPGDLKMHTPVGLMERQVHPWFHAAAWLAPLALLGLLRRPWQALALFGTALPFLVALRGMTGMVEMYPRFLSQALPGLAVCGGVLFGLLWGWLPWGRLPRRLRWIQAPLAGALILGLVLGAIPSPLSPAAPWRLAWAPELSELYEVGQTLRRRVVGPAIGGPERCVAALRAEREAGLQGWSRLLSFDDRREPEFKPQRSAVPPVAPVFENR